MDAEPQPNQGRGKPGFLRSFLKVFGIGTGGVVLAAAAIAGWHVLTFDWPAHISDSRVCRNAVQYGRFPNKEFRKVGPLAAVEACTRAIRSSWIAGPQLKFHQFRRQKPSELFFPSSRRKGQIEFSMLGYIVEPYLRRGMWNFVLGEFGKARRDLKIARILEWHLLDDLNDNIWTATTLPLRDEILEKRRGRWTSSPRFPFSCSGLLRNFLGPPPPEPMEPGDAVQWALILVDLDDQPPYVDTLAAALANLGLFDLAVVEQELALEGFEREGGRQDELAAMRQRLRLFKSGKRFRNCRTLEVFAWLERESSKDEDDPEKYVQEYISHIASEECISPDSGDGP